MANSNGRGLFGSVRRRADHKILRLVRDNRAMRRARYSLPRRALRYCIVNRSFSWFVVPYLIVNAAALLAEGYGVAHSSGLLLGWTTAALKARLQDIAGFLIAAQVG